MSSRWPGYLDAFHTRHPGITEQVLCRARADGDAYDWLAAIVPTDATVLDVGCGNAPLRTRLPGRAYVGVDINAAELTAGRRRGAPGLIRATAAALPVRAGSIDAVTCSMALQILTPLPRVLAEISRVLRPGGRLVATVPARHPLRATDLPVLAGLLTALGRRLAYPNDGLLHELPTLLRSAGLTVIADDHRRFRYRPRGDADADLFLAALYLPNLPESRRRAARAYVRALARARVSLPVPVRRITAQRSASPGTHHL